MKTEEILRPLPCQNGDSGRREALFQGIQARGYQQHVSRVIQRDQQNAAG